MTLPTPLAILAAMLLVFGLLLGWIAVQHAARRLAARRPELGPAREEGGGCSLFCLCRDTAACPRQRLREKAARSAALQKEAASESEERRSYLFSADRPQVTQTFLSVYREKATCTDRNVCATSVPAKEPNALLRLFGYRRSAPLLAPPSATPNQPLP